MYAVTSLLRKKDSVYHAALRFVSGAVMDASLYTIMILSLVIFTSKEKQHMYLFIAKTLLCKLPSH